MYCFILVNKMSGQDVLYFHSFLNIVNPMSENIGNLLTNKTFNFVDMLHGSSQT